MITFLHKIYRDFTVASCQLPFSGVKITASMKDGTGLIKFAKAFPERFFDIGIAEQHAITMAAGMAKEGMIPFVQYINKFIKYHINKL